MNDLSKEDMVAAIAASFARQAGEIEGLDRAQLARGKEVMAAWSMMYGDKFPFGCVPPESEWPEKAEYRLIIDAGYVAQSAQRRAVYFTPKS